LAITIFIAVIALLIYLDNLRLFFKGLRNKKDVRNFEKKSVSVVAAARNEQNNISQLLTSLINQSYPQELYEIIIVDDESSDKTVNIVAEFQKNSENIKLIRVENHQAVKSPKKNALTLGINDAKGDIIMTTDADCIVSHYWIESHMNCFEQNISMVVGLSRTKLQEWKKSKFLRKFENFDFLAMFSAASGAISVGKIYSCSGQNLAYTKQAYEKVGGFTLIENIVSGDDVLLMQLFNKNDLEIIFNFSHHNFVYTKAVQDKKEFFNQRARWASDIKWIAKYNIEFLIYLISTFLVAILPLFLVFVKPYFGIPIIIIRIAFEYTFLKFAFEQFLEPKEKLKFYPYWYIFQPFYIFIVMIKGMFNSFDWKK
jgi:cellulose synthase/poly-beta-1,6-N-acetylglucosamine synthase-like glycosyltransferase